MYVRKERMNSIITSMDMGTGNDILPVQIPEDLFDMTGPGRPTLPRRVTRKSAPVPRYERINLETIHDLLLRWANGESIDSQLVKHCIDYVKGFKEEVEEEEVELHLEEFKEIGELTQDHRRVQSSTEG
jgi:hypothetical protein